MLQPTIEVRAPSLRATIWTYASGLGRLGDQNDFADRQWRVIARFDRHRAGSLSTIRRTVIVGDDCVVVAGVGNVLTRPEFWHSGVASAMLNVASDLMRKNLEAEFGLLMCRRGWRRYTKRTDGGASMARRVLRNRAGRLSAATIQWCWNLASANGPPASSIYAVRRGESSAAQILREESQHRGLIVLRVGVDRVAVAV